MTLPHCQVPQNWAIAEPDDSGLSSAGATAAQVSMWSPEMLGKGYANSPAPTVWCFLQARPT